jgi:hypothetical protein
MHQELALDDIGAWVTVNTAREQSLSQGLSRSEDLEKG